MKYIIVLLFVMTGMVVQKSNISEARKLYSKAAENEKAARSLLELSENKDIKDPVVLGYKGAGHMMMAKHVGNPFKKLSHFNKGKGIFSSAIAADKQNLELRFLRFAVQAEAPAFLGYRDNLEEDKALLIAGVDTLQDKELQNMILDYLKTSKGLTAAEKEKLK
ncbi:hypothetical protein [Salinimicrobium sp. TH3]|uniref:hypothetical protein n=1 Tax=Salinimicrobium sp. TH3 TaxID=2997342 RepID=UPI002273591A|nr:hypothetical protein [Salinimicrobium sp. TH3]MCY2688103.1 hypothetical protein [Salinimicrobium sp. TH3]